MLGDGINNSSCRDIFFKNNDVYITGYEASSTGVSTALFWKNGVKTILSNGNTGASSTAIFVK